MRFKAFRIGRGRGPRMAGERIYLRSPVQRDWREWAALRAESHGFLTPWEPTWPYDALTRRTFRRRVRLYRAETRQRLSYSFFLFRRSDNILLGGLTVSNLRRGVAQSASLGYWIGNRHSRQGYMAEALNLVLRFAFDDLALHRIEAACLPDNQASRGLLLKCGFREEGFARAYLRINGRWQDHTLFAILRDEFEPAPPALKHN